MTPLEAAEWANIAYEDEKTGQEFAAKRGFSFVLFTVGSHQCVVGCKNDLSVVAFRGTEFPRWRDIITNINARQIYNKAGAGMVHQGYHNAAWKLLPNIKSLLRGTVYFTGHSMGGAIAIQAGSILKPDYIYTFNAPKSGDSDFAKQYPVPVFRFVSHGDFAQSYPSDTKEWQHVGRKITLESRGHSMDRIVEVLG
ncbi:lipase family protein [Sneathiella glossodoripedis]|uniref:lipase family protein n=1 Tax=Sneathiella glossodoripedis TaxID=418853 RepID=UPI0004709828|nr:lipase family protein [Sneathiella glossodoripedis]